ncbi:MAG: carboxypeptidase regulatory-like domain-containing protein [Bryobacteraceae bacterium]
MSTRFLTLLSLLLAAALALSAQTASVTGIITDPSGAVIAGATLTLTNTATGVDSRTETNAEGYYRIPSIPPGNYRLGIEASGFRPFRATGLQLIVGQVARLDYTLELGSLAETVEVSARAVLLDSETSSLGQVIGGRQITELPLLGRNAYSLATLVPGVRSSAGMNDLPVDQISTVSASINGARASQNEFLLDGAPNTAAAQNQPVIFQNVDSVQEFKVETNAFSAEYGRAAGGVFNVVTKSGTNDITFTAYEFLRNDKLNANDFFANRAGRDKAPFRFNQFGGVVGGPVVLPGVYNGRNRTFFFGSAELVRFTQGVTWTGTVPRPEQLAGDFSTTRNAAGNVVTIYDPLSTAPNPGGGFTRTAFPGNRIPQSRFDPVASAMSSYWPAPNATGAPNTGVNNYARTGGSRIVKDTWSMRLDHHINERNRLFGRFSFDDTPVMRAPAYGADNIASPTHGTQTFTRYNTVIEDSHVFSPTLLGTVRASYARLANIRRPFADGFDITTLGLPGALRGQLTEPYSFPVITITGIGTASSVPNQGTGAAMGGYDFIQFGMDNITTMGSMTKTFSRNTLKAGGEFRAIRFNTIQNNDNAVNFGFTPAFTQGPNPAQASAAAGVALASFLLGTGTGSITPSPALSTQNLYYALYLQNDWRVTQTLTLNLGIRYDYETPRTERYNQLTNFDWNARPPLDAPGLDLRGALAFVGTGGLPRYQANPDRNNISPRAGFAWRFLPRTVLRGGGGLFYGTTLGIGGNPGAFGISGYQATTQMVGSLDGVTPFHTLRNPYPDGLISPTGNSLGAGTLLGQGVAFTDRAIYVPYTTQWNLNIQHELPGSVLFDLGYAGSRGVGFAQTRQFNQLPDSALSLGDGLRQQVPNPFFGQIAIGPLAARTVPRAQLLRPFPHFTGVASNNASWASSNYHSMQLKIEKRYSRGFSVLGSWTWSKLMDYGTGPWGGEALGAGGFQNWNDLRSDWSVSTTDQTHRLVINGVWALPFFQNTRGFVNKALGGWELGAINSFFSGGPIGVSSAVNNTFSQGGGQRPNWNGQSPRVEGRDPNRWIDPSAFSIAPAYAFGNAPRTLSGLRTDTTQQLDLTLSKTTRIYEKLRLQFRSEFFNITNTARFAPPNSNFGNPQFGVVASQLNQPRIIQFGVKLFY